MINRLLAPVSAFFLFFTAVLAGPAQAAPPVEAFGSLPTIGDVQISPNGKLIAMLQTLGGKTVASIYTLNAPAGTQPLVFNPESGKVNRIMWANDDRLLIWMSISYKEPGSRQNLSFEVGRVLSLKADGSDSKFLFRDNDFDNVYSAPRLLSTLPNDPAHILMAQLDVKLWESSGKKIGSNLAQSGFNGLSVYKVDVADGRAERVEAAWKDTRDWVVDPHGTVRMRIDGDDNKVIHVRGAAGGEFKELARYDDRDPLSNMGFWGFGTNPNTVYVTARRDSDRRTVYAYDITAAKIESKIFGHDRYDVSGALLKDQHSDRFIGARYTDHMSQTVYWDQNYASMQRKLEGVFKGQTVSIISASRDQNAIAVLAEAPGNPGTYYLYEPNSKRVSPLGARYSGLASVDLGMVTALSYEARDGLTIPAYLTLPPGKEAKNLPLIVMPHGGPEARDDQSFDWWASFYVSRGYAVLKPNFRGSRGYGARFVRAGYGEFGGKMQDDLTDGVKHLVAKGIADPRRVCIIGASYGGYAALAGASLTPDVYACAVSVNGMSDLNVMIGKAVRRATYEVGWQSVDYWQKWLGDRHSDTDRMKASSPAHHAEKVRAPVLMIHGKDDTVVPFQQSELMSIALKKAGKPYKLIEMEGEDHWLSKAESRILILKETEAFLKEHIGG